MRKLVVKEWMTPDGVFDAETMDHWWNPYDSTERQAQIIERFQQSDTYLLGRATYELLFAGWSQLPDEAMAERVYGKPPKREVHAKPQK